MSIKTDTKIICITPVKNETWILNRFLKCASLWADHIIIADQMSEDGSREIARKYEKVRLIDNTEDGYSESARVQLMIGEARKISGKKLLIALDADETISSNYINNHEWATMIHAKPGTAFKFERVNIFPDMQKCSLEQDKFRAVVDDNFEGDYTIIHGLKVPIRDAKNTITLNEIKILHYQFTNWQRMKSKQRWYQVWHSLDKTALRPLDMYRLYHPAERVKPTDILLFRKEWIEFYEKEGIDMTSVSNTPFWGEKEVLEYFEKYEASRFKKLDIWDVNWDRIAEKERFNHKRSFRDPRNFFEKMIHNWLAASQRNPWAIQNKIMAKVLRLLRW